MKAPLIQVTVLLLYLGARCVHLCVWGWGGRFSCVYSQHRNPTTAVIRAAVRGSQQCSLIMAPADQLYLCVFEQAVVHVAACKVTGVSLLKTICAHVEKRCLLVFGSAQ